MLKFLYIAIFVLFSMTSVCKATTNVDLTLLNINKIGPQLLTEIKTHGKVAWWVEIGEKLIVALNNNTNLPAYFEIIGSSKQVDVAKLLFQSNGHCNHSVTNKEAHADLDLIFGNTSFQLVSNKNQGNKAIIDHDLIMPFTKNKVLIYQYENRFHEKAKASFNTQMDDLIAQVDKNRWFLGVEKLASYDRMLDIGLVAAGEWLEGKFAALGLTTSRIDLHGRRGFNVLGFKLGTTKPDEWYVVGAHLDSRNQPWDDALPSPGAEDNASGCSGVLEIATVMSQYDTEASIMFICFNAEERGLLGSGDVVETFTDNGNIDKVKTMLNMDMISYRLGSRNIAVAATDNPAYQQLVETIAENGNIYSNIDWQIGLHFCCTDFVSFTEVQIPAATSNQPDISTYFGYHRVNDLPENVDPLLGSGIVKANLATLADMVGVDFNSKQHLISAAHTGSWFNPNQSGHGLNIEILANNRIIAYWYTYDNSGNQVWLLGVGTYANNIATLDVQITVAGVFPPNFVADDVIRNNWGTFQFEFSDCNRATFSWTAIDNSNFPAGTMPLTRLTSVASLDCRN